MVSVAWCNMAHGVSTITKLKKQKQLKKTLAFRKVCDIVRNGNEQHNRSKSTNLKMGKAYHVGGPRSLSGGGHARCVLMPPFHERGS